MSRGKEKSHREIEQYSDMMDDLTDIRKFYNAAWDAEENRLDLLFEISSEQSMVASSRHILYIGKKSDD